MIIEFGVGQVHVHFRQVGIKASVVIRMRLGHLIVRQLIDASLPVRIDGHPPGAERLWRARDDEGVGLDPQQIRDSAILYLEAYLWRSAGPRAAIAILDGRS